MVKSRSAVINNLYQSFVSIYQLWEGKQSQVLCKKMLEDDVILLGLYFSKSDEFGQVTQFNLVCETVAQLRMIDSPINNIKMIDYWTDLVMEELQQYRIKKPVSALQSTDDIIEQLQSTQILRTLYESKVLSNSELQNHLSNIMNLVDLFIIYNGRVTDKEIAILNDFENSITKKITLQKDLSNIACN